MNIKPNSFKSGFSIILLIFFGFALSASGQHLKKRSTKFSDNWYINANVGVTQYYGDLSNKNVFQKFQYDTRIGTGLIFGKQLSPSFGLRLQGHYGKLYSRLEKKSSPGEGAYMQAEHLITANLALTIDFTNLFFDYSRRRVFFLYGVGGVGMAWWQSEFRDLKTNQKFAEVGKDQMMSSLTMPFGFGGTLKLTDFLDVSGEIIWAMVFSDELDAKIGGSERDIYSYLSAGLAYKFNMKKKKVTTKPEPPPVEPVIADLTEEEDTLKEPVVEEPEDLPEPEDTGPPVIVPLPPSEEEASSIYDEPAEVPELEFRVQIRAAYGRPVPQDEIAVFGIPDEIKEEYTDGWYRYTVGSFDNLDDAQDYKYLMRNTYDVNDAFVVAYVSGKRLKSLKYLDASAYRGTDYGILDEEVDNIRYGVQISASNARPLNIDELAAKYNLDEPIREDYVDGWYRYSVGSFSKYWRAKEYRNILLTRNNVKGSFVIAYKDDIRYSIVELLGIEDEGTTPRPTQKRPRQDVEFRVQVLCLEPDQRIPGEELNAKYNIPNDIIEVNEDGLVKYQVGNLDSYEEARAMRNTMIDKGINDAFVVPYLDGVKIPISEAFVEY